MTNNYLLCCVVLVWLLNFVSPTHAQDHNNGTKLQPSATPSIKLPPPAYSYNNTSPTSTIKNDDLATYCVSKSFGANLDSMAAALSLTCGVVDCSVLQPGSPCFEPESLAAHASYAFNLYYQKNNRITGSCDFNGTAMITSTNPSHGTCMFTDHNSGFKGWASRLQYSGVILALGLVVGVVFELL
ncbi:hypothetical protein MKX03_008838 [Papaver bracteatum]|nr:hypothetical protein MKX03_008838 [Papaver bracteatum]